MYSGKSRKIQVHIKVFHGQLVLLLGNEWERVRKSLAVDGYGYTQHLMLELVEELVKFSPTKLFQFPGIGMHRLIVETIAALFVALKNN